MLPRFAWIIRDNRYCSCLCKIAMTRKTIGGILKALYINQDLNRHRGGELYEYLQLDSKNNF